MWNKRLFWISKVIYMGSNLSNTLNEYIMGGCRGSVCALGDEFAVVENPSFDILPDHPYRSPFVVAIYCHGGSGRGRINAATYQMERDSLFIVLPGQITELVDVSSDFEATYIIMSDSFTESLNLGNTFNIRNSIVNSPYTRLGDGARNALESYLKMCVTLISVEHNPHRLEILQLLTRAFFLGLGYFLHESSGKGSAGERQSQLTDEFLRLVEGNYREHRDLAFYADSMCLTPKYLSTVVKSSSGRSAVEWIERHVTIDAITQLTSTHRTIKQIAHDLNFPSQSCFGKYFVRVVGLSPRAYRAKHRN